MLSTIRIGFVGAGNIARSHAEALGKIPGASIVGIADADTAAAESLAAPIGASVFGSVAELAAQADLDALFILLPPFAHGRAEEAALKHRIPFFVEKPVTLDMGFGSEIASEVARLGLVTSAGYMNRYRESVQRAKKHMVEEPGILAYGGWWGGTPQAGAGWWPDKSKSGGQFHEQATHTADLVRYLMGEPIEVYAAAATGFVKGLDGYSMDDAAAVTIRLESGGIATLMTSMTSNAKGAIFLDLHSMSRNFQFRNWDHSVTIIERGRDPIEIAGEPDIFGIEDAAFLEALRTGNGDLIRSDYADGLKTAALSLAANASLQTGKPVSLV